MFLVMRSEPGGSAPSRLPRARIAAVLGVAAGIAAASAGCSVVNASVDPWASGPPAVSATATAPGLTAAPAPAASASTMPPAPLDHPARTLTLTGSGDVLIHPSLDQRAQADGGGQRNFAPMLSDIRGRINKADYSICHQETPFSDPNVMTSYPRYYINPLLAKGIAATGFDDCSIASNWTFDKGLAGIGRTTSAMYASGVNTAGGAAKAADAKLYEIHDAKGIKVAHISFTDPSDSPAVPGAPWAVNRGNPAAIAAAAKDARAAGAEIVIVSLAMGEMGPTSTGPSQDAAVNTITAGADVDYIIGHGSHTIQNAELVNGTWVVWHGNLLAHFFADQPRLQEGLISEVTFVEQPGGRFTATNVTGNLVYVDKVVTDLVSADCGDVSSRWMEAYNATKATEAKAIKQGFLLPKPCSGASRH